MITESVGEAPFNFNLEEMEKAVNSPRITLPRGLTGEQRREFLRERLREIDEQEKLGTSAQ